MKKDYLLGTALKEIGFKRKKIKDPYQMYVKNYGGERIFSLIIDSKEIVDATLTTEKNINKEDFELFKETIENDLTRALNTINNPKIA